MSDSKEVNSTTNPSRNYWISDLLNIATNLTKNYALYLGFVVSIVSAILLLWVRPI